MDGFGPAGVVATATLPPALELATLSSRPSRSAGSQPLAAIVLLEIETKGLS